MNLNHIYSPARFGTALSKDTRSAYQRDYDRIIFSSAFRRLQNKTQVFPLPGSVFVHNRLTHSLEVASVGRSLGFLTGEWIADKFKKELTQNSKNFYKYELNHVISAGCLCHDIGNPAFGHSGEDAIASYFKRNEKKLKNRFSEREWFDFVKFEGNANAIRILTQVQNGKISGSIDLSFTTLASIAKYPCEAVASDKKILHRKKFGFFQSEKNNFNKIVSNTSMLTESRNPLIYQRHPLVWLIEAADDICYNIIDLEDAHRLGIIDHNKCAELFLSLIFSLDKNAEKSLKNRQNQIIDKNEKISFLRAKIIGLLTQKAAEAYQNSFEEIIKGMLNKPLLELIDDSGGIQKLLDEVEQFSIQNIYNHYSVVEIENAGYNVMYELLSHFVEPVLKTERSQSDEKAIKLIPNQFLYEDGNDYQKVMGVLDFVSGMTDNYATELYRRIKGIEIGMRR